MTADEILKKAKDEKKNIMIDENDMIIIFGKKDFIVTDKDNTIEIFIPQSKSHRDFQKVFSGTVKELHLLSHAFDSFIWNVL